MAKRMSSPSTHFERPHLAGGVKEPNIPFAIGPIGRRFVQQARAGGFPKLFVDSIR
jgi:hypothetical protein